MTKTLPSRSTAGSNWIKRRLWQREAAVRARRKGTPVADIAKRFDVSQETVYAWLRAAKRTGGSPPPPRRPGRVAKSPLERAALERTIQRHVAHATEEDRTTSALTDWLEKRYGIRYAESTVRRLLWRVGCSCITNLASGAAVLVWSYPLPERPEWLTPERLRRIEELVRKGVSPRSAGDPLTRGALLEHMASMKQAMKIAGASEDDLVRTLFSEGIIEHPISKALVFERDVLPATKAIPSPTV
jgi:transposase